MATMTNAATSHGVVIPYHVYHAEAHVLSGKLEHPVKQPIEFEGHVVLQDTRREAHLTRSSAANTLEGLISFKAAYTRASGNKFEKKRDLQGVHRKGWVTLSTSIIEGLNVFEVITADRVVAQVSTDHPEKEGHVPIVTFLGTRFENLRVSGYPVNVTFNYGICGKKPAKDRSYLQDKGFLDRIYHQADETATKAGIPLVLKEKYNGVRTGISQVKNGPIGDEAEVRCSIVDSIDPIPELDVTTFGNVMVIPNFGTVALGELRVGVNSPKDSYLPPRSKSNGNGSHPEWSSYFHLDMLNMTLGCIGGGNVTAASAKTNGVTRP